MVSTRTVPPATLSLPPPRDEGDHDDRAFEAFPPAPAMSDHQEENAWIGARMREIQEFWHDRFDEDESLRAAGSDVPIRCLSTPTTTSA